MTTTTLRRAQKATRIFQVFANWKNVYASISAGKALQELRLRDGLVIQGPTEVELWNHFNDIWENQVYTTGKCAIPRNGLVIDIGANVGIFSLYAARFARVVHSFEPSPEYFGYLSRNIAANNIQNIECYNKGVSKDPGVRHLYTAASGKTKDSLHELPETISQVTDVECITLSDFMEASGIEHVDLLKVDCEGCEFEVLLNLPSKQLTRIKSISLEFHDHLTPFDHSNLKQYLEANEFETQIMRLQDPYGIMHAYRKV